MKKTIGILMAVMLVAGMMPLSARAASLADIQQEIIELKQEVLDLQAAIVRVSTVLPPSAAMFQVLPQYDDLANGKNSLYVSRINAPANQRVVIGSQEYGIQTKNANIRSLVLAVTDQDGKEIKNIPVESFDRNDTNQMVKILLPDFAVPKGTSYTFTLEGDIMKTGDTGSVIVGKDGGIQVTAFSSKS